MEILKWVFSAAVGITMAVVGIALTISALIFATVIKTIGLLVVVAGILAVLFKEAIDSRSKK